MISFNNIGYMGRLGNQMFQYAALRGIAFYKNYQYSLPQHDFELKKCFNLPITLPNTNINTLYVSNFEFDESFYTNCPDNTDIAGYFQTEKYFENIKDELQKDFTFKKEIINVCTDYFNTNNFTQQTIALHIRRTDYLTDSNFIKLDLEYYVEALKYMDNNFPVIVFSDDPEWCEQQTYFQKNNRFFISKFKKTFLDLCAMSMCDYHVIANSSFSWWGSWLAKSKKTIAPKQWFDGKLKNWNTKDLYLNSWIVI